MSVFNELLQDILLILKNSFNPLMPNDNKKVTHTQQTLNKGLFKYV